MARELQGLQVADGAVRALLVEVLPPGRELPVNVRHAAKHFDVQTPRPEPAIKAHDECVLGWLSWADVAKSGESFPSPD